MIDQTLLCFACSSSASHKGHDISPVEEVAQMQRESMKKYLTTTQVYVTQLDDESKKMAAEEKGMDQWQPRLAITLLLAMLH